MWPIYHWCIHWTARVTDISLICSLDCPCDQYITDLFIGLPIWLIYHWSVHWTTHVTDISLIFSLDCPCDRYITDAFIGPPTWLIYHWSVHWTAHVTDISLICSLDCPCDRYITDLFIGLPVWPIYYWCIIGLPMGPIYHWWIHWTAHVNDISLQERCRESGATRSTNESTAFSEINITMNSFPQYHLDMPSGAAKSQGNDSQWQTRWDCGDSSSAWVSWFEY